MYICSDHFTPESFLPIKGLGRQKLKPDAVPSIFPKFPQHLQVSPKPKWRSPKKCKIVEPPTPSKIAKEHLYACQSEFDPNKSKQEIVHLKKEVSVIFQWRVIEQGKGICFDKNLSTAIQSAVVEQLGSAVFDQSQEHFFDHYLSIEADHLTTLLRLVTRCGSRIWSGGPQVWNHEICWRSEASPIAAGGPGPTQGPRKLWGF